MQYRLCSLLAIGLISWGAPRPVLAATIDCMPLRPGGQGDSVVEDTIKAQANILLRSLGSGSIENGYRHVQSDTLARYPAADKLLLWREYIYVSCTILAASSHWSDDDKWDKWMQLMNRWNAAPPTDTRPPLSKLPEATPGTVIIPAMTRPVIGGVGLGTRLEEIQARKDIGLSLDADGNPYGEETFTFTYGLRHLDADVVFDLRGDVVSSITVTHTLGSTGCADSATATMILNEQIRDWGAPLRRMVPTVAGDTVSYVFRRDDIDMVLVLQTSLGAGGTAVCRVSMNYQRSV